jgi:hypothetical protein
MYKSTLKWIMSANTAAAMTAALAVIVSCAAPQQLPMQEVTFAVMGNTSPASPFTGQAEKLEYVFKTLNKENPMLVIHTGDIVQGGNESMGITLKDIERQYENFRVQRKVLRPILHILAGEKDLYNGSLSLFTRNTGEQLYYSFNYGNAHFILLHILNKDHRLSQEQKRWLKRDLEINREHGPIFIFSHYPVMAPPQAGTRYADGDELHALFKQYPVKAVIAGSTRALYEFEKDGIKYAVAGCFGYTYEDWHWSYNQYYLVGYDGGKVTLRGVRVNFPANSYRPKMMMEEP